MIQSNQKHRPNGAPPKAAPVFLIILYHKYFWIFLIYSLYIPYIFPSYVKYVFPCVFLDLWSQEKTSLYLKTTEIFYFLQILRLLFSLAIILFLIKKKSNKIVPYMAFWKRKVHIDLLHHKTIFKTSISSKNIKLMWTGKDVHSEKID